jgi:phosphotransferase system enzyme I (PtsI)
MELHGMVISKGIAVGKLHHISSSYEDSLQKNVSMNPLEFFYSIQKAITKDIENMINDLNGHVEAAIIEIFKAHKMMVIDPYFTSEITRQIEQGKPIYESIETTINSFIFELSSKKDLVSRRTGDFQEILIRFQSYILESSLTTFAEDTILICNDLTPFEFMHYKDYNVKGFILRNGSNLSHTSFLAKSFKIPMIIHVDGDINGLGEIMTLDTNKSLLTPGESFVDDCMKPSLSSLIMNNVTLSLNLISTQDLPDLNPSYSGVGLFRTEFLSESPIELSFEKQIQTYHKVLEHFQNQDVVLRVFDFSNDKSLGKDAIKDSLEWLLDHPHIYKLQLNAMMKANIHGNLSILLPMVTSKALFDRAYKLLKEMVIETPGNSFKLGVMVERISVIDELTEIFPYIDFISIGTNDLSADLSEKRRDEVISTEEIETKLLELIEKITALAKDANVPVSICGEFAHNVHVINQLIEFGVERLSMDYEFLDMVIKHLNSKA